MKTDLVVNGYLIDNNKVLLIHHGKLDIWIPVGGHIEKDETPDNALKREIKEETNLDVEILNQGDLLVEGNVKENLATPFCVNIHSVGDHDHCAFYYVCRVINPNELKINKELKNARWFTKNELDEKIVPIDVKKQALKAFEIYEQKNK